MIKKINFIVTTIMEFICAVALTVALFFLYDSATIQKRAKADNYTAVKPVAEEDFSLDRLQAINPDVVGWITIDNTNIDYPVMKATSEYTYLNKDMYGNSSLTGSLYIDSTADWTKDYVVIYGHHMAGGLMFGNLDYFKDDDYLQSHNTGTLITSDKTYRITPLFTKEISAYDNLYAHNELDELQRHFEEIENGKYLILSTCIGEGTDRLILIAKLEEI